MLARNGHEWGNTKRQATHQVAAPDRGRSSISTIALFGNSRIAKYHAACDVLSKGPHLAFTLLSRDLLVANERAALLSCVISVRSLGFARRI